MKNYLTGLLISQSNSRYRLILVILFCNASVVAAETLTFKQALVYALQEAPALRANAAQIEAAELATIPAGELPDPKLRLGIDNLPISGPDRYSLTQDFMTMQRIGVMQEFPNQRKRKAYVQEATAQVALMQAYENITAQQVLQETALAWIQRNTVEQQINLLKQLVAENQLFESAVQAELTGGKKPSTEIILPKQEAAMIDEYSDELTARHQQAIAQLRRWIGVHAELPLSGDVPAWPIELDSLHRHISEHPELIAFEPKRQVLNAELSAAEAAKYPDWALELAYQKRDDTFGDMVSLQISFDLPLFPASRQHPKIHAKRAELSALDAEQEASTREHIAILETDFAEYQRLVQAEKRINNVLLPLAEEKIALALSAWQGGKNSLTDVIIARREHINTQLKAIALTGERQKLAARLHYAYGDAAELPGESR